MAKPRLRLGQLPDIWGTWSNPILLHGCANMFWPLLRPELDRALARQEPDKRHHPVHYDTEMYLNRTKETGKRVSPTVVAGAAPKEP
eukprot:2262407-Amphidinium_carterae.1